ncbi:DNA translocase FtsK [Flavobacterium johnsoniae]|jgi:S-DNA-T family DNA segregation ATPase FtsK/SpoIIIE|uniref:DNA segregation ATPase FtsK/SpoIIIE, S-DNA-T family n=2 Tax=Flavobacterium johnsoniae TaxID=986 RepID=A0A1M5Q2U8_FLAJO|nr:DNA translocase FtsK [Flavobacterium johnsoniae]ABQ05140.1 cell divisionFtsK/SpoIIIE [Flavobacterium johnsoniae UW101]OXG00238.1 cell division protein FtsK [Flavobacterium johnsoniae UW101]WQG83056.1 DNA translocase FtsK [Flavobacterium johnsoniae UW101]SHH08049.1 DNA segregation ATPase FtsK/SpoIIIE, S-DNA-T family [Flavobacterium johnsoniae]SHL66256.1 DNA segregation ATPase FtsK/SpoIIIE, S-DNA-T family [Flavobacterium johnsoniae]
MAKSKKETVDKKTESKIAGIRSWKLNKPQKFVLGCLLVLFSIALLVAFISFYVNGQWQTDQSAVDSLGDRSEEVQNWLGKFGAYLADLIVYRGFGLASFILVRLFFLTGLFLALELSTKKLKNTWFWDIFAIIVVSVLFGFFATSAPELGGTIGYELNIFLQDYIGKTGTLLTLLFGLIVYLIFKIKVSPEKIQSYFDSTKKEFKSELNSIKKPQQQDLEPESAYNLEEFAIEEDPELDNIHLKTDDSKFEINKEALKPTINHSSEIELNPILKPIQPKQELPLVTPDEAFVIEKAEEEDIIEENLASRLVADFGLFDPTLDLSNYKFPTIDLLKEYSTGGITINQEELEENKNKIVDTLRNYKIEIAQIKATVGPSVTLYEIVPEAGIRISKIKSLEDDIALSLSALGIRIIAPIPGKGTIGIEVPNKTPTMVSMKSVIGAAKFQEAEMELPIALGKTISNETFVVDLAKMPHLLMAGATGQGKSVGLNAVLTSLLYKKHPAEVKFVLVDPKKVELTLFNKIERHYLAKLPDTEDAIITDNAKVVNTLNSLCTEMDNRYSLLKDAMVRNIKEYNEKFKSRKLNPEAGHRFLPYIVLVVDEFADLIMTAGKEVEVPIARLAQLARAIGIHLIIATQRPSVNVITGLIKANFPARIAFRVTSKIDSRTILDTQGADQLIGRGDLLYTNGNDVIRVQCAFIDTPEVEKITDFIGSQKAYATAYLLPEFVGEETGINLDMDISERDTLFREAAEIIVNAQQGSASLLQRKLKLGYNRAGRLIDQLEAAGIVGPFEGSKARSVNILDLSALDQFFNNEQN